MEKNIEYILRKMPKELQNILEKVPEDIWNQIEEFHFRLGQPAVLTGAGNEYVLEYITDEKLLQDVMNKFLNYSYYAFERELSNGFITIEGGHRMGICGKAVLENGEIKLIKDISSVNIRRCRELIGISDNIIEGLFKEDGTLHNIIIVSSPKCGKTTLLRDIIRNLSYRGFTIGLCDERSEIAGSYKGKASFDIGPRTDVLDGCPKDKGISMLIRSMSPDIIATDEIGKHSDITSIEQALCAGISIITTIHGSSYEDLLSSEIHGLIEKGVFTCLIFLDKTPYTGFIREIRRL